MPEKNTVLVVDDDPAHRTMLRTLLAGWGYEVAEADDGSTAIERVHDQAFDLILMDIRMIKVSGLQALVEIKAFNPAIPVIIMTAYSSVETAVEALKNGAYDYLTKPLDFDELRLTMERAMDHRRLKEENRLLRENLGDHFDRQNIIGRSAAMGSLLETVAQVAPTEATVLLRGESGTGKEMIAGAIHFNSVRKDGPFVKINCAAITETLLESELFGHEKGAFTGAHRRKEGRFVQAHGGSLFLDEISEMSLAMQVKLLRVLQEREITRVGGEDVIKVDVRIIAATNKDLLEEMEAGRFREDLYYRLNVVTLTMPPLRERKEDIPLLAQHFLNLFAERNRKQIKGFSPQAMDWLIKYDWPGNVRELMNAIERGVVLSRSDYLDIQDLPLDIQNRPGEGPASEDTVPGDLPLEKVEKATILKALELAGGNKSETARRLGITRRTLHKKLKKYGAM
ncbi:MAG: sigma-54-dependent Fis family transcriptional regulator [Deltaproteobacteria bacterium]|nr:sigma-54-dependent Fis family transcriptional regulator [Deltaproteobacteria bacterium]MBW2137086.1 sigma-54-dependent Fis family transcriptional regulator [Deltaproteobacteria bacterium]